MTPEQIHEAARLQGIAPPALDQVSTLVQSHFGDGPVKPADLAAYLATLPVWTKIGMDHATFAAMPAAWRLDQGRAFQAPPPPRRPVLRTLTSEELATLEGLPRHERHERGRAMQQTPAPPEP
jgi:hypothetical protein